MPAHSLEADEAPSEGIKIKWLATIKEIVGPEPTVEMMELDARGHPQPTGRFDTQQLWQPIDGEGVPEVLASKPGAGPRQGELIG